MPHLQVAEDFEYIGRAVGLKTVCVYGGAPMGTQERLLMRGVDVVVGTPGRVKVGRWTLLDTFTFSGLFSKMEGRGIST